MTIHQILYFRCFFSGNCDIMNYFKLTTNAFVYIDSLWHNELVLVDNRCLCIWIQCIWKYLPRDVSWPKLNPRTATETRRKTTFFMAANVRLLDLTIDCGVIYVSTVSNLNITRQKCAANRIAHPVTMNQLIWEYCRDQPTIREHYLIEHVNLRVAYLCVLLFMTGKSPSSYL